MKYKATGRMKMILSPMAIRALVATDLSVHVVGLVDVARGGERGGDPPQQRQPELGLREVVVAHQHVAQAKPAKPSLLCHPGPKVRTPAPYQITNRMGW